MEIEGKCHMSKSKTELRHRNIIENKKERAHTEEKRRGV